MASTDPMAMLEYLRTRREISDRKSRLLAVAFCRRVWGLVEEPLLREAVLVAERYADGEADEGERREAEGKAHGIAEGLAERALGDAAGRTDHDLHVADAAIAVSRTTGPRRGFAAWSVAPFAAHPSGDRRREGSAQCGLLRDIMGNPFRPVNFDQAWRTPPVIRLAEEAYYGHSFEILPVLGDALEEAGCHDPEILEHCRADHIHARGCWVLDGLLKKS
jgi:hypothetical protein